jgi:hypothetical protein
MIGHASHFLDTPSVTQFRHMPLAWQGGVHSQETAADRIRKSGYTDGDTVAAITGLPVPGRPASVIYVTSACRKTCDRGSIYGTLML